MKGTLSSTRSRPQTYSIRGAGGPLSPPRVSPCLYCSYSVRDSAPNSTPYFSPMPPFGNASRSCPPQIARSHPLTPESSSASIRSMAKARKPSSGSSRHSKGTARSQSKSQKKKTFPPPPPAQRGGVELVDPLVQAQLKVYDEALSLFHQQKFARAKQELEKVLEGPSKELADRARMHVKIAEQRMKPSHEQNPRTADEHYQRGVAMMNIGRWDDARESLDKARKAAPKADHIHYALAALDCLTGEADSALANLKVAIQLRPENRYHARNDEDFAFLQEDPRFTELLYPEKDGTAG
jgi:predicted Zn-dependent protease